MGTGVLEKLEAKLDSRKKKRAGLFRDAARRALDGRELPADDLEGILDANRLTVDDLKNEIGRLANRRQLQIAIDAAEGAEWAYNVVIHEFAHVIDMADGSADGVPPLPDLAARERWIEAIDAAYEAFCDLVDSGVETVLDPYGAEAPEEFFAVAVEAFFVASVPFKRESPELYALLSEYFKQDPAPG